MAQHRDPAPCTAYRASEFESWQHNAVLCNSRFWTPVCSSRFPPRASVLDGTDGIRIAARDGFDHRDRLDVNDHIGDERTIEEIPMRSRIAVVRNRRQRGGRRGSRSACGCAERLAAPRVLRCDRLAGGCVAGSALFRQLLTGGEVRLDDVRPGLIPVAGERLARDSWPQGGIDP